MVLDWIYQQIVGLFGELFTMMNQMGVDLFGQVWVKKIISLFQNIGWALFVTGIIMAIFEYAIQAQSGRGDLKGSAMNIIKGFLAVSLFSVLPVELYAFTVNMQSTMSWELAGTLDAGGVGDFMTAFSNLTNPITCLFVIILFGYAVIKVFFASLKRGGILLIQISVGSLYMFSVPRGYTDGFVSWIRQVIGTCLTAFMQSVLLVSGLIIFKDHIFLGLGIMLSAGEVPRIAGAFGLESGTRANIMSAVYAAQGAVNLTKTIVTAVK